ncbi:MAG TPA: hypothetical protein VI837_02975 [Blastocatellia bacterium]|nr:hypothetical protein [Blastocatellia bacterium]
MLLRFKTVVSGKAVEKLRIEGIAEAWLKPGDGLPGPLVYRPAVLVEYTVNFRSLRAGLNHSEERSYSAWLPEADLAMDWDSRGDDLDTVSQLAMQADPAIGYRPGNYLTTKSDFEQCVADLIERLVRTERLSVYYNPVFGLFSAPGDPLEDFLTLVADAALGRIEPELKRLRNRFELQLEQVREAQASKGSFTESLNLESFISNKLHFFESENRLAGMFSTLAGAVFGSAEPRSNGETYRADEAELREDLERIEQEASEALRALYDEYLALANEYDTFEIGVQPDNLQVIRNILLWVPVDE